MTTRSMYAKQDEDEECGDRREDGGAAVNPRGIEQFVKGPMTAGYDCYQNALAERINGILKHEFLLNRPADLPQAGRMVAESVQIYNQERPHLSLKMQTPKAVHRASMAG